MVQANVHTLPFKVFGHSVVFASTETIPRAKHILTLKLLEALGRLEFGLSAFPTEKAITLCKGALGKPRLFLGKEEGPSLSFSQGEGRLWAAMCGKVSIGIDVAYPVEFPESYPFARAFCPEELEWADGLCHRDKARGAALLWSAKEASVKATGTGFHLLDPLEVRVRNPLSRKEGVLLEVSTDRPISAWAREEGRGWVSMAWL